MLFHLIKLVKNTLSLDLFSLYHVEASEEFNSVNLDISTPPKQCFVQSFWTGLKRIRNNTPSKGSSAAVAGKVWFFVLAKNDVDAALPVMQLVDNSVLIGKTPFSKNIFREKISYVLAAFFFVPVVYHRVKARGYRKKVMQKYFFRFWHAYGLYILYTIKVNKYTPSMIVFSNDHSGKHRTLKLVAEQNNIPTVYIQHASIGTNFPPLDFNFALLEGECAFNRYREVGIKPHTKIFLIGMPKSDPIMHRPNLNKTIRAIGLCASAMDPMEGHERIMKFLRQQFPEIRLVFRPHPSDFQRYNGWLSIVKKYDISISNPTIDTAFTFLENTDAIIAGECSIHLEAALKNVMPIYHDFGFLNIDHYGYIKNELAWNTPTLEDLALLIKKHAQQKPTVKEKTKYYCHTVGTLHEGHSSRIAAILIQGVDDRNFCAQQAWKPFRDNPNVFELQDE